MSTTGRTRLGERTTSRLTAILLARSCGGCCVLAVKNWLISNGARSGAKNLLGLGMIVWHDATVMSPYSTNLILVPLRSAKTRKNFGPSVSRKRGESNFMRAFERAYFARRDSMGMAAGEFSLSGFGVADLVWIGWRPDTLGDDFTALALEKQLERRQLHAFEGKLKDWRRGLQQAFRYRYFADKAIVVMPHENATAALGNLDSFKYLSVGFWTFETKSGVVREHFTPTRIRAFSDDARAKAIKALASKIDLRQFRK